MTVVPFFRIFYLQEPVEWLAANGTAPEIAFCENGSLPDKADALHPDNGPFWDGLQEESCVERVIQNFDAVLSCKISKQSPSQRIHSRPQTLPVSRLKRSQNPR
jgi:hypothetical protein